ncbi:MAG: adenine phosphoribosyltransferase [Rhodothermales bacterium]|nr:adenine phosphoribosyltransferase [Rhodothermales bacterium]
MHSLLEAIRTIPDFPEPGIQFKDITPILSDPKLLRRTLDLLAEPYREARIDKVIGIESRGFIFGAMLAEVLDAGFIPIRKKGKLPAKTVSISYDLEYGSDTIEMHADAILSGDRVLIHDDVIATGGTAAAAAGLVSLGHGDVVGYSFLAELEALNGRGRLPEGIPVESILKF